MGSLTQTPPNVPKLFAILPSAGSGSRLGLGYSKGLIPVSGKTSVELVIQKLRQAANFSRILVVVPANDRAKFESLKFPAEQVQLVLGGETRQDSVYNGLKAISSCVSSTAELDSSLILIHDVARFCCSELLIRSCIEAAREKRAITAAIPVVDTLALTGDKNLVIEKYLDRQHVWAVQTPQVFDYKLIMQAHQQAADSLSTDDSALVRKLHPVHLVPGEKTNFKVTTLEDLKIAEKLID